MRTRLAGKVICIRCKSERTCLSLLYIVRQGTIIIGSSLEPLSKALKQADPLLDLYLQSFFPQKLQVLAMPSIKSFSVYTKSTWLARTVQVGFQPQLMHQLGTSLWSTHQHRRTGRSRKSESEEIRRNRNPLIVAWVVMTVNAGFLFIWGWCSNYFIQFTKDMMVMATTGLGRRHPMDNTWSSQAPSLFL